LVTNVLQVNLNDFKGFGAIPVDECTLQLTPSAGQMFVSQAVPVSTQYVANGAWRYMQTLVFVQIQRKAHRAKMGFVLGRNDLGLNMGGGSARLVMGRARAVVQITVGLFLQNIIHHAAIDAKSLRGAADITSHTIQII